MNQILIKILHLILISTLLLTPTMTVALVYAQEASQSAQIATPSARLATLEAERAQLNESSSSPLPLWQTVDGVATTQSPVVLSQTYHAPQNDQVTLIFTKLPPNPQTLTIKQVTVSQLFTNGLNPVTDIAYDITSTMEDGTFEYNLTLPTPATQNVEVKASEDGQTFVTLGGVSPGDGILTITGLNHFTVFVVTGTIAGSIATPFDETGSSILINEFMFDPDDGNDWVELYNKSDKDLDLSGWRIEDGNADAGDDLNLSGRILARGLLVFQRGPGWLNDTPNNNNPSDTISLKNPAGQIVSQVTYIRTNAVVVNGQNLLVTNVVGDNSIARQQDGSNLWEVRQQTKGYNNNSEDQEGITFANVGAIYPFQNIGDITESIVPGGTINVAAGQYSQSGLEITTKGVRIIGPGVGPSVARAIIKVNNCSETEPAALFHLHSDDIVLSGLELDTDNNCEHVVHVGGSDAQVANVLVEGNAIHGGDYGVTISTDSSYDKNKPNTILNNEIYQNKMAGILLNSASHNVIQQNNIHDNPGVGIQTINEKNRNSARLNVIIDNAVAVRNDDQKNSFNAVENYWGHSSGPNHIKLNPLAQGGKVSDRVFFSPFYLDENLNTLETLELNTEDLSDFVENGIFDLPDNEEGQALVEFLTVLQQFDFEVAGASEEEVTLPKGTRIERSDDAEFEWADLAISDFSEDSIQGLGTDFDPVGALQWGIPNVELEFNQPITIDISVGTILNGQTLSVRRSTSGSSGWTSAGIVAPATCVVANGICTFQATKASYFTAARTVTPTPTPTPAPAAQTASSASTGSSSGGSVPAPSCDNQKPGSAPVLTGATAATNSVTLNWTEAKDPLTYYLITYGLSSGRPQYGNPNIGGQGTANYTVQNLSGGQTYYFKVRAGNGCMPGDFSNELAATPAGGVVTSPAVGFQAGVLGRVTEKGNVGIGEQMDRIKGEVTASAQPAAQPQAKGGLPFKAKVAVVMAVLLLGGFGLFRLLFK